MVTGRIFNIQRFSVQDGPGIRTTIFLKGCPLACPWCSNPESQRRGPDLGHVDALCDGCGRCVEACKPGALSLGNGGVRIDRDLCNRCGDCIEKCGPGALRMFGREISVDEAFRQIKKDVNYYRNSDGGVTASGGEPLLQSRFVSTLFRRCQDAGIHTTLDTCGYAPRSALDAVLEVSDLVLFDLKLMSADEHAEVVKAPNGPVLENARAVASSGVPMIARIPLIPGLTEKDDNVRAVARFVRDLGPGVTEVNVLPYHRFGTSKYDMLDLDYELADLKPPSEERVQQIVGAFEALQLPCEVVT